MPSGDKLFGQIHQHLRCRRVVGPVTLINKENSHDPSGLVKHTCQGFAATLRRTGYPPENPPPSRHIPQKL